MKSNRGAMKSNRGAMKSNRGAMKGNRGAMKTLLLYKSGRPGAGDYFARMMPVGLGWINATLRQAGFDCSLANLSRADWSQTESLLRRQRPDLVGITLYTFNRHPGLRLARLAKKANPECTVIVGGPHATHMASSILRHFPAVTGVAIGEGEMTMLEVARAVAAGRPLSGIPGLMVRNETAGTSVVVPRATVADLDALPFPAPWYAGHRLDVESESSFIITSRGCPARCTFCNTPDFWGTRMRFRGPEHMLEEIRYLRNRLGILYVSIRDDTFTVHKKRVIDFCKRLIDARLGVLWNCQSRVNAIDEERLAWMRRAGCEHIQYGIESGSERLLRALAKDITLEQIRDAAAATRRVGLPLSIYLISGVPGETPEDFAATRALVNEILPHDGMVAPLAVFPGTRIHDDLVAEGRIDEDYWIRERRHTLYLMEGAAGRRSFGRLAKLCERVGRKAAYTLDELAAHTRQHPGAFAPLLASGDACASAGDLAEALSRYEEILRHEPDNVWGLLRTGMLLAGTGDRKGGRLYLERARGIVPQSRMVREALAAVERSRPAAATRRRVRPALGASS